MTIKYKSKFKNLIKSTYKKMTNINRLHLIDLIRQRDIKMLHTHTHTYYLFLGQTENRDDGHTF